MNMGLGLLGDPAIRFKTKNRWTFEVQNICGGAASNVSPAYCHLASRPSLEIEEVQIDYLNARDWIPGKGSWNTLSVSFYDISVPSGSGISGSDDVMSLFTWISSCYNFFDPIQLNMGSNRNDYAGTAILTLYSACGDPLEQWVLGNCWTTSVEWGDLDMADGGFLDVTLTLRYSQVKFTNLCGRQPTPPCCTPC